MKQKYMYNTHNPSPILVAKKSATPQWDIQEGFHFSHIELTAVASIVGDVSVTQMQRGAKETKGQDLHVHCSYPELLTKNPLINKSTFFWLIKIKKKNRQKKRKGENLNEINDEARSEEEQAQWHHDSRYCNSHVHSLRH